MNEIHKNIDRYYTEIIKTHGSTPLGVGWNGEESQLLRFKQLSKIINKDNFSIADIGCGYGKYYDFLSNNFQDFNYKGYDLSKEMIKNATSLYTDDKADFLVVDNLSEILISDYCIASGIFNVSMEFKEKWMPHILETLIEINQKSVKGFSFNMLTKYSDKDLMLDNLYYADPLFFFDYCKNNFSKNICLLHDYDLYEFTILVNKH